MTRSRYWVVGSIRRSSSQEQETVWEREGSGGVVMSRNRYQEVVVSRRSRYQEE